MAKDYASTIGYLVGHHGVRDAIHCPIISVIAKVPMAPGEPLRILETGHAERCDIYLSVGIVDPWLKRPVETGDRFWAWIRPGSISSLSHTWQHKAIPSVKEVIPAKEAARVRLEEFAEGPLHVTLEEMLEAIASCADGDDAQLYDHGYEGLGVYKGFWEDYVLYTGKPNPDESSGFFAFFTCGGCS